MPGARTDFDIAIIGAGPAGSSAAITSARLGARVALFDVGEFPRQKVCGEFVSAESIDVLRDLLPPAARPVVDASPVIEQARLLFSGRSIRIPISPTGLSIARYQLDFLLWRAASQSGARTYPRCEVRAVEGKGPFRLDTSWGKIGASSVIIAAGRWSRFTPSRQPQGPKWLGLKTHYYECQPPASADLYFFRLGYCGVQRVAGNVVNVCAMIRSDVATSLNQVFAQHSELAERALAWQAVGEPISTAPLIYRVPQPGCDNLIQVGDAAAFIDPFVGDGISIALRSGRLAAFELASFVRGTVSLPSAVDRYRAQYKQQFVPLIDAASRIRALLSWPKPAQKLVFELLRTPGILPYFVRRTRRAA